MSGEISISSNGGFTRSIAHRFLSDYRTTFVSMGLAAL
jgi:hypothetical protein